MYKRRCRQKWPVLCIASIDESKSKRQQASHKRPIVYAALDTNGSHQEECILIDGAEEIILSCLYEAGIGAGGLGRESDERGGQVSEDDCH